MVLEGSFVGLMSSCDFHLIILTDGGETVHVKRKSAITDNEPSEKRPRLSESYSTSPSFTSSPSSRPDTPPHTHKPSDNWIGGPQRSPVIKIANIIPYPGTF